MSILGCFTTLPFPEPSYPVSQQAANLSCLHVLQSWIAMLTATQQPSSGEYSGKQKQKQRHRSAAPLLVTGLPRQAVEAVLQLLSLHCALAKLLSPKGEHA